MYKALALTFNSETMVFKAQKKLELKYNDSAFLICSKKKKIILVYQDSKNSKIINRNLKMIKLLKQYGGKL